MAKQNPFMSMQRMKMPAGMRSISIRGFELEADEDGCVDVPKDAVDEVAPHGLVPADVKEVTADDKKKR